MPINLLDLIKGEGAAVSFIRSAVEKGIGLTETLENLRSGGLKIRTQTFYQVANYFKGPVAATRNYVSNIGLRNLPNIGRLQESLTKTLRNFSYQLKVEVVSTETGEKETRNLNVSSSKLLTKQEAIDQIANTIEQGPKTRYPYEFSGAQVTNIFKNPAGINEELLGT